VGRRRHLGHLLQQGEVLGMAAELVVADERPERRPAEHAVLLLVDLLEQGRLVELAGLLHVLEQVLLVDVHDLDLQRLAGLALVHEVG
jgi:pyrroloquinoline quinone (PQQ) biosynthesis protein C